MAKKTIKGWVREGVRDEDIVGWISRGCWPDKTEKAAKACNPQFSVKQVKVTIICEDVKEKKK